MQRFRNDGRQETVHGHRISNKGFSMPTSSVSSIGKALLAAVLLAACTVANSQESQQANAEQLLNRAEQTLAVVVAAARKDPSLNLEASKSKPFWDGLKDVGNNVGNAKRDLEGQDKRFFTSLASAIAGYAQAEIALIMIGNDNAGVSGGMSTLGGILQTLNENYSKEAARLREGGELTTSEKQKLDKLIAQQDELIRKLEQVEANVAANNEQMKAGIAKMKEEARKIKRSQRTVAGFTTSLFAAHILYDWLWGWHWWWGPWGGWCPGYIDIGIIIWDGWADEYAYDWALAEDLVDIADLELGMIDALDIEVADNLEFLDEGDFGFDGDLSALTEDLDHGWDDISTDAGAEIVEQYEENFDNFGIYDRYEPVETFEDYGVEDFGDDMGSMDFGYDDFGDW